MRQMDRIVVRGLCDLEILDSIGLVVVDKKVEVCLELLILAFGVAVRLGMVHRRRVAFNHQLVP